MQESFEQLIKQLADSREKLKAIIDTSYDAVCIHDKGVLLEANDRFFEMYGYEPEELIGRQVIDMLLTPKSAKVLVERVHSKSFSDQSFDSIKKNGTIFPVRNKTALINYQGKELRLVVIRDISKQVEIEQKLYDTERFFHSIVENLNDGVMIYDYDGRVLFANKEALRWMDISLKDCLGSSFEDRCLPDKAMHFLSLVRYVFKIAKPFNVQVQSRSPLTGEDRWLDVTGIPLFDKQGRVEKVMAIICDIHDRKIQEEAIKESECRYRSLVEGSEDTVCQFDRNGAIVFINSIGAERLGMSVESLLGQPLWEVMPGQMDEFRQEFESVASIKKTQHKMVRLMNVAGLRWKLVTLIPMLNEQNEVTGFQGILRDIDEIKQMEQELERYYKRMAEAERLAGIGMIGATMAHELNQPLSVIRLLLQDMQDEMSSQQHSQSAAEQLQTVLHEVNRSVDIVKRYKEMTRLGEQRTAYLVDLSKMFHLLKNIFENTAKSAQLVIEIDPLVDLIKPLSVGCDLEQIAFILISNAIDAAHPHKQNQLKISGTLCDGFLTLVFTDDCVGIEAEKLELIFEPFYSTKPRSTGTGLGLTIVKKLITDGQGEIRVQSVVGKGVTLTITLPVIVA